MDKKSVEFLKDNFPYVRRVVNVGNLRTIRADERANVLAYLDVLDIELKKERKASFISRLWSK